MGVLGFADLRDAQLPELWDAGEITKVQLADGRSFESVIAELRQGLQAFNRELLGTPHYSWLFAVQDDPQVMYKTGVFQQFQEATEYGVPAPARGATTGHMLPIKGYDYSLGWTMMYLLHALQGQIDADVGAALDAARDLYQRKLLERFFKVEAETIGTTGKSVPFADGGASDPNYVPPVSPDGRKFTSSHNHFLRLATLDENAVNQAVEHLWEHGHTSPFEIIGSQYDVSTWQGLSTFVSPAWPEIVYGDTERAKISDVAQWVGFLKTPFGVGRLWLTPRLPAGYFGVYKYYGEGDPRNPLRIRINPKVGFGVNVVPGTWVNQPMYMVVLYAEFGVGVGSDRTNGVCVKIAGSGSYTTPTIS